MIAATAPRDRYRVLRPLGMGGTATVELVWDRRAGRELARKRPVVQHPRSAMRLRRELAALEDMRHAGVVAPGGIDADDQGVFLTMEAVEGEDLFDHCRPEGPLSMSRLAAVLPPLLDAIAHVHARGWTHRDLKPSNILVTPYGEPRLIDFGMAGRIGARTRNFGGTPTHMAPEQIRGAPPTAATDLYVIGVTLFELISGDPPFEGPVMQLFGQHLHAEAPRLRDRAPEAPEALAEVVDRLLSKEPDARPSLTEALRALAEVPGSADRSGTRLRRPRRG